MWFHLIALFLGQLNAWSMDCSSAVLKPEESAYFTWAKFSEDWAVSMANAFSEPGELAKDLWRKPLRGPYLKAIAAEDRRITELSNLGIHLDGLEQNRLRIGHLKEVVQKFNDRVSSWMQEGRIAKEERLIPGVAVQDENGQLHLLPYGVDRPQCHYVTVSARPTLFTKMLKQGIAPISSGMRAIHDINHLRGLSLNPRYMALSRRLADLFTRADSVLPLRDRYVRFFHWYEGLALFPEGTQDELVALLTDPSARSPHRIFQIMQTQPPEQTIARGQALIHFAQRRLQFFGGAGEIGLSYKNPELSDSLPRILSYAQRKIELFKEIKDEPRRARIYPELCAILSKAEIALWYATSVSLEDYFQGIVARRSSPDTPLGLWFQPSAIGISSQMPLFALSLTGELNETHDSEFSTQFDSVRN